MRSRDAAGLTIGPLLLRLMLAVIFINAGLGKIMTTQDLPPEQAARLANLGGLKPGAPEPAKPADTIAPTTTLPEPTVPTPVVPADPDAPAADEPAPSSPPAGPDSRSGAMPALVTLAQAAGSPASSGSSAPTYTAADFPNGAKVKTGLTIALSLEDGAHPKAREDGKTPIPLWPDRFSKKPWPVVFAWTATLTELIGGALLIIGLFTRLSAFGIAFTMLMAMWLTQIGPAIQSGQTVLGFLPNYPAFDPQWMGLMFQFSLFAAASALVFLGAGAASLDAAIFGGTQPAPARRPKPIDED